MKIFTRILVLICFTGVIFSCKPSKICPAYHSYFILDPEVTQQTFSILGPDSLPREPAWQIEKQKVGIADDFSVRKKERMQKVISMESVYIEKEDPFDSPLAMAEMDSVTRDSLQNLQRNQVYDDFYNYDQMIYLHHFGKYFPRPQQAPDIEEEVKDVDAPTIEDEEPETEEKKGFFGNIFGKKKDKEQTGEEELIEEETAPEGGQ